MVEELGTPPDQRAVDNRHLYLLSLFHFIGAGFALLGLGFIGLHFALFNGLLRNPDLWKNAAQPPPPALFDMLKWLYVVLGAWYGASLVLNLLAGMYLHRKTHRTFCFVVAAMNCLHMPVGTVLGIFTIIVLARDSVRGAFESRASVAGLRS
jgi:hypothetical protein